MTDVQELYADLLTLLRDMLNHYRRLLALSHHERQTLTAASLPALLDMTIQKETLILELSIMDEGRQLLLRKLAESLHLSPTELTLRKLSQWAPEPFATDFDRCRTELMDHIQALTQVNAQNRMLLSSSLDSVRTSLTRISRLLESAAVYGHKGYLHAPSMGGKVLHQEV